MNTSDPRNQVVYRPASRMTAFLQVDEVPMPEGFKRTPSAFEQSFLELLQRGFELCDVFSNSDHHFLARDNANDLGLGADVERMYISRAYRFNSWGMRAIDALVSDITTFQSTYSSQISSADSWITNPSNNTLVTLEVRNMFYDQLTTEELSRDDVGRMKTAVDNTISAAQSSSVNAILNSLKSDLNSFKAARTALFSGVATALMSGSNPSVTWNSAASIHVYAPQFKAVWVVLLPVEVDGPPSLLDRRGSRRPHDPQAPSLHA